MTRNEIVEQHIALANVPVFGRIALMGPQELLAQQASRVAAAAAVEAAPVHEAYDLGNQSVRALFQEGVEL